MSKQQSPKRIKEVILSNFDRKVLVTDTNTDVSILKDYDLNEDFHSEETILDFIQDENGNYINEEYEKAFTNDRINLSFVNSYFEKVKKENPNINPDKIVLTYSGYTSSNSYCYDFRISHFRIETDEEYQERLNSYELKKQEKQKKKEESKEKLLERKKKQLEKLKKELGET